MFLMTDNKWARLSAYVTGLVNHKLLLQNEYLAAPRGTESWRVLYTIACHRDDLGKP